MLSFRILTVFLEFLWLGTSIAATGDTREEKVRERLEHDEKAFEEFMVSFNAKDLKLYQSHNLW